MVSYFEIAENIQFLVGKIQKSKSCASFHACIFGLLYQDE
jgi:hypothetical protein